MSVDTLNKHVLQMLTHLNKYPIPDPQMVRDFNWFIKKYDLSVQSGEVTAPGVIAPNEVPTIMVNIITVGGAALSLDSANGFVIEPNPGSRLYCIKITIEGNTAYTFSYNYNGVDISIEEPGGQTLIGEDLSEGSTPTTAGLTEGAITIFCDDGSIPDPNSLTDLTLIVRLYTA
jgi:hypothetical protein